jgi:Ca2+-binding EF-hand superfamily protein
LAVTKRKGIEDLFEAFAEYDREGTGFISSEQLALALAKCGYNLSLNHAKMLLAKLETNGLKKLNIEDLIKVSTILCAFGAIDKNNSSLISCKELSDSFSKCGYDISLPRVKNLIGKFDSDGDKTLNIIEFMKLSGALDAFSAFDCDNNGSITGAELSTSLARCGYDLSLPHAKKMIAKYDNDGDKRLNIKEFIDLAAALDLRDNDVPLVGETVKDLKKSASKASFKKNSSQPLLKAQSTAKIVAEEVPAVDPKTASILAAKQAQLEKAESKQELKKAESKKKLKKAESKQELKKAASQASIKPMEEVAPIAQRAVLSLSQANLKGNGKLPLSFVEANITPADIPLPAKKSEPALVEKKASVPKLTTNKSEPALLEAKKSEPALVDAPALVEAKKSEPDLLEAKNSEPQLAAPVSKPAVLDTKMSQPELVTKKSEPALVDIKKSEPKLAEAAKKSESNLKTSSSKAFLKKSASKASIGGSKANLTKSASKASPASLKQGSSKVSIKQPVQDEDMEIFRSTMDSETVQAGAEPKDA